MEQNQNTLDEKILHNGLLLSYDSFQMKEKRSFTVVYHATITHKRNKRVIVTALDLNSPTFQNHPQRCYELFIKSIITLIGFQNDNMLPIIDYDFDLTTMQAYFVQPLYEQSLKDIVKDLNKAEIKELLSELRDVLRCANDKETVLGNLKFEEVYYEDKSYYFNPTILCKEMFTCEVKPLNVDLGSSFEEEIQNKDVMLDIAAKNIQLQKILTSNLSFPLQTEIRNKDAGKSLQ